MDFEFTDDQLGLRDVARGVLATACPSAVVRSVYEKGGTGDELWSTLVGLDWPGLGSVDVAGIVEELARVVAPTPFLATVTQLAPMLREAGAGDTLTRVANGSSTGTLAIAEHGVWRPEMVTTTAHRTAGGWTVTG